MEPPRAGSSQLPRHQPHIYQRLPLFRPRFRVENQLFRKQAVVDLRQQNKSGQQNRLQLYGNDFRLQEFVGRERRKVFVAVIQHRHGRQKLQRNLERFDQRTLILERIIFERYPVAQFVAVVQRFDQRPKQFVVRHPVVGQQEFFVLRQRLGFVERQKVVVLQHSFFVKFVVGQQKLVVQQPVVLVEQQEFFVLRQRIVFVEQKFVLFVLQQRIVVEQQKFVVVQQSVIVVKRQLFLGRQFERIEQRRTKQQRQQRQQQRRKALKNRNGLTQNGYI